MGEPNFYSYLYSQSGVVAFDEVAEVVELWNPDSIQRAFVSYLTDYDLPVDIKEDLLEEKFYLSSGEGDSGEEDFIRYDMAIPGLQDDVSTDELQSYFEDFLENIGAKNDSENGYGVEVDARDNERGGIDLDIYIFLKGKQIVEPKKQQ